MAFEIVLHRKRYTTTVKFKNLLDLALYVAYLRKKRKEGDKGRQVSQLWFRQRRVADAIELVYSAAQEATRMTGSSHGDGFLDAVHWLLEAELRELLRGPGRRPKRAEFLSWIGSANNVGGRPRKLSFEDELGLFARVYGAKAALATQPREPSSTGSGSPLFDRWSGYSHRNQVAPTLATAISMVNSRGGADYLDGEIYTHDALVALGLSPSSALKKRLQRRRKESPFKLPKTGG
jgi:hypothetical protein